MKNVSHLSCSLHCKASENLEASIAKDLECQDRPLKEIIIDDEKKETEDTEATDI